MTPEEENRINEPAQRALSQLSLWAQLGFWFALASAVFRAVSYSDTTEASLSSATINMLAEILGTFVFWGAILAWLVMAVLIWKSLTALRDRALAWQPLLDRSYASIDAMHKWPIVNIVGPIIALVETGHRQLQVWGVALWSLTNLAWLSGIIWYITSDSALNTFRATLLLALASAVTSWCARYLAVALTPEATARRYQLIPDLTAEASHPGTAGFWDKGLQR